MKSIISSIKKVILKKKSISINKTPKFFYKNLRKQGFYNGKIWVCVGHKILKQKLILDCGKLSFFDFVYNQKKFKLIGLNAVIRHDNSIIFIKRDKNVFSCPNIIDFPAGLAIYGKSLLNRLINRIKVDTGISKKYLNIEKDPFMVKISKRDINLFFKADLKDKAPISDNLIFLKNNDLKKLKNKMAHPEVIRHIWK